MVIIATAVCSWGQFAISVSFGPPLLPVYAQPICPAPGYIWVPGYWAWSPENDAYYWVPGTWLPPPQIGLLWTPGYWAFSNGMYVWNVGYWGPSVGFYGGINYGFGYPGDGYYGGQWRGREFYYNRAVNNVTNITNVYNQTVVNNTTVSQVAYNGGPSGVQARPTPAQVTARQQQHVDPTPAQLQHQEAARRDPSQFASPNQGKPAVVATPKPGALNDPQAKQASLPPASRSAQNAANNAKPEPQTTQQVPGQQNLPRPPQNNPPAERAQQNVPRLPATNPSDAHNAGRPKVNEPPPQRQEPPAQPHQVQPPGQQAPHPPKKQEEEPPH